MGYHWSCIRRDGEKESCLRGAGLGLWVAPGHLDCGSLNALLLSLCYAQISSMPWAKLLSSQASTAACGAMVVQGSHNSSPAQDSSHNHLAHSAACCLLYGLSWGWGWPSSLCFQCRMRRAELSCSIREGKTHGGQCASKDTHSLTPSRGRGAYTQEGKTERTFVSTKLSSFTTEEEETVLFEFSRFSLSALLQCSTEKCCL